MTERDDYDVFLETWDPSERLLHASIPQYLEDQISNQRLLEDSSGKANLNRTTFASGVKVMEEDEETLKGYEFFKKHQAAWSAEFRDYLLFQGLDEAKVNSFIGSFANHWVDGKRRRQDSIEMMEIKASIRDHDLKNHHQCAGQFVQYDIDNSVTPLFTPTEMEVIFTANESLLEAFLPDYLDCLEGNGSKSINDLYARRGVLMPTAVDTLKELHYLSSYSFALTVVEQFAQTWTPKTKDAGIPSIFSAPLPAIQKRVVAFAPFIEGMDLGQLELVVAPPTVRTPLEFHGVYDGIYEYSFR